MLKLKERDQSINPAHIEQVLVVRREVIIVIISETGSITVDLETVEDAIFFAEYVELLVDISNTGRTDIRNEMVRTFESYFQHKDILRPDILYQEHERLKKLLTEQNRKS